MLESKNIATPDDKKSFEHGEICLVNLLRFTVARTTSSGTTTVRAGGKTSPGRYRELFVLRRGQAGWKIFSYMYQPQPEAA